MIKAKVLVSAYAEQIILNTDICICIYLRMINNRNIKEVVAPATDNKMIIEMNIHMSMQED